MPKAKPAKAKPKPKDPVKVDSKHYKVEAENKQVRVLRINYGPGEKSVMHGHPTCVALFLTESRAKFTFPDGKSEERSWPVRRCSCLRNSTCPRILRISRLS